MRRIDFGNKIECLVAKREPVTLSLYQPQLDLIANDTLGPHYDPSKTAPIIKKIKNFIEHSISLSTHLIVFPEYGAPLDILFSICRKEIDIPNGTLVVLPLETLTREAYNNLKEEINNMGCLCNPIAVEARSGGHCCVNACAIIASYDDKIDVYLQPKRYPADLETSNLCGSTEYFVFKGIGLALTILICSDANKNDTYKLQLEETYDEARGMYVIHTQWNPKPAYTIYEEFWRKVISSDKNPSVHLISNNVARGSIINNNGNVTNTAVPYMRVACSGDGKRDKEYMNDSNASAFKSTFEDKFGHILNLVYPLECGHIIELRRPHEGLQHAVNFTKTFMHSCRTFKILNGYEVLGKDFFLRTFCDSLKNDYRVPHPSLPDALNYLSNLTLEQIEILTSSCLLEEKYKWLEKKILSRPVIWAALYKNEESSRAKRSIDYFVFCLMKLNVCEQHGYQLKPSIAKYPINLKYKEDSSKDGWVFHCMGLSMVCLYEEISQLLSDRKGRKLSLFSINCGEPLRKENFTRKPIFITDPGPGDETVTDHRPSVNAEEMEIFNL